MLNNMRFEKKCQPALSILRNEELICRLRTQHQRDWFGGIHFTLADLYNGLTFTMDWSLHWTDLYIGLTFTMDWPLHWTDLWTYFVNFRVNKMWWVLFETRSRCNRHQKIPHRLSIDYRITSSITDIPTHSTILINHYGDVPSGGCKAVCDWSVANVTLYVIGQ